MASLEHSAVDFGLVAVPTGRSLAELAVPMGQELSPDLTTELLQI